VREPDKHASSNGESDLPGATWHWASHGPFAAASLLEAPALGFRFDGFQSLDLGHQVNVMHCRYAFACIGNARTYKGFHRRD
jgi:hypothetical protein